MPRPPIRLLSAPTSGSPAGAVASALLHVAVGAVLVGGPIAGKAVIDAWDELPEGLRFLVPPPKAPPSVEPALAYTAGSGDGGTSTATTEREDGQRRAGGRRVASGSGVDASAALDAAAAAAAMNAMLATSYQVLEVDSAATPDPSSAAPVYPPDLEASGVEGYVIIRFVVDSTGLVDLRTLLTVEATNAAFDRAVRDALPRMKFRPAKVGDRAVRQLAEQLFRFEIAKTAPLR